MADPAWMRRAACRGLDPALFHPDQGGPTKRAKDVCRACPVRAECLEHALTVPEKRGIWGGEVAIERKRMRGRRARAAAGG